MPVQRLQRETTSTEFVEWQRYIELDLATYRREDYYLAQIAAEARRSVCKNPASVKLEHFLIKFQGGGDKQKPLTDDEAKERVMWSKAKWLALTNAKPRTPPNRG